MGKVTLKERRSKSSKQKRRLKSSNKYLKPSALAQPWYGKVAAAAAAKLCTDLGKKRVAVLGGKKAEENDDVLSDSKAIDKSPMMLSPVNLCKQNGLVRTPKTPRFDDFESESRLESLPMDLLVKILCHLHHDQLRAVFHVSQKIRKAVCIARQFHFNYTTPDRSRQEMLRIMTPQPTEHWPFVRKGDGDGIFISSPHTPKAPRHGPRPPSRLKATELRQVSAKLFQDPAFQSRCMVPSVLSKPLCKSVASNRVLFYEDELCQAVAQNKLL
ncbi:hypothetical protein SLEP1_g51327 [Rubroshorea leprosula]|uniref:F-box domain-containing protein n=1 Tax=Rubroshorea leprosula TaxID=152421 RepID=A0AAV5M2U2_9ROSI|nr:hypothetical protein SLEP1_g51327 [Rubroshorea leprosula]